MGERPESGGQGNERSVLHDVTLQELFELKAARTELLDGIRGSIEPQISKGLNGLEEQMNLLTKYESNLRNGIKSLRERLSSESLEESERPELVENIGKLEGLLLIVDGKKKEGESLRKELTKFATDVESAFDDIPLA